MITVGDRPILWHIMKWYASLGHDDFMLCLGYKGECIKEYFLNYNEALSNDFVLSNGGARRRAARKRHLDWRITFVDTGAQSTIGERLRAVAPHLGDDENFLATYGDGADGRAAADDMIERLRASGKTGLFLSVRPIFNAHVVACGRRRRRHARSRTCSTADVWINGGFFVFRREILDDIDPGEELVDGAVRAG